MAVASIVLLAVVDGAAHPAGSPDKQIDLMQLGLQQAGELSHYLRENFCVGPGAPRALVGPPARDRRFVAPEWRQWAFNMWHQAFLLNERWWAAATQVIAGVE